MVKIQVKLNLEPQELHRLDTMAEEFNSRPKAIINMIRRSDLLHPHDNGKILKEAVSNFRVSLNKVEEEIKLLDSRLNDIVTFLSFSEDRRGGS